MSFVSRFTLRLLTLSSLMVSQGPQHFWFFVEVQVDCDTCFSGQSAGFYFLFPFFFLFLWLSETVAHRSLRLFRTEQYVRFVSMFVHISGTITLLSSRAHTNSAHINETRRTDWGSSACRQDRDCFAELRPTKVRLHPRVWKIYRNGFFSVFFFFVHSCTIELAYSVSKSSPKGNDSELEDKTGCRKSGVSLVYAGWLVIRDLSLNFRRQVIYLAFSLWSEPRIFCFCIWVLCAHYCPGLKIFREKLGSFFCFFFFFFQPWYNP